LPPPTLRDLSSCSFIDRRRNLVIAGPPGIGKSHIAQGLGYEAAKRGMDVLFFKTHKLMDRFAPDRISGRRSQLLMKRALGVELLILDDFAFRAYSQRETELLYAICDERLGSGSIIVTSNRPPEDWYSVFPDPVVGGAVMDRLVSGAVKLIVTSGRSYRKEGRPWEPQIPA
jgi:DNA replication protein DnaC